MIILENLTEIELTHLFYDLGVTEGKYRLKERVSPRQGKNLIMPSYIHWLEQQCNMHILWKMTNRKNLEALIWKWNGQIDISRGVNS